MHGLMILLFTLGSLIKGNEEIRIVFAGDAMQHSAQIEAAKTSDGKYDYSECFESVTPLIESADYAVVNLETPLAGAPYTGYPCFSAPDAYLDALAYAGFDMMLTANNHTLDKRSKGAVRTLDQLDGRFLDHLGTYRDKHERDSVLPMVKNIGGFKIGFLNYTYGTNGIRLPESNPYMVHLLEDEVEIREDIREAKAVADCVIVFAHWGTEDAQEPDDFQRKWAEIFLDCGVDVVVGTHPHVLQPVEVLEGADGHEMLIFYSIGNYISAQSEKSCVKGGMASFTISFTSEGYRVSEYALEPLTITWQEGGKYSVSYSP